MVEHEPQRLDGSRIDTRLTATPSASAARRLAASRSPLTSRLRKSEIRRATCGAAPATQSRRSPASPSSIQTVPRCSAPVHDAVIDAAQRDHGAMRERRRYGQPAEPRRDPAAMFLGEFARLLQAAARRHGEHDFARDGMDAQRVAPRLPMAAHAHQIDFAIEDDVMAGGSLGRR